MSSDIFRTALLRSRSHDTVVIDVKIETEDLFLKTLALSCRSTVLQRVNFQLQKNDFKCSNS